MLTITKEQALALARRGIEYSVGKCWHPETTEDGMAVVIDEHLFDDEKDKDVLDIHLGRLRPTCGFNYLAALKGLKVKTVNALPCEEVDVVPDWTIEEDGALVNKRMGYEISPDQLRDQDDWILHLMEKPWVNLNSFIPAYFLALRRLGIKDAVVLTSYE